MKPVPLGVLALFMAVLLPGCAEEDQSGSPFTRKNFDRIRADMTYDEVKAILGEPTEIGPLLPSRSSLWSWQDGEKKIEVLMGAFGRVEARGKRAIKRAYGF
jgi:hypothetical protein